MHILIVQHVPFEGPGMIIDWAHESGHSIATVTASHLSEHCPALSSFDMLVVMGGPMGVYEDYPWIPTELDFIRSAIDAGKPTLGICLGAQMIASALGAKVYPHDCKEIGWLPVFANAAAAGHPLLADINQGMTVLHWHGDTFDLPEGAMLLMSSKHCMNQAFLWGNKVIGLQFHLEMAEEQIHSILHHCAADIRSPSEAVQSEFEIVQGFDHIPACRRALYLLLDNLAEQ